MSRSRQPSTSFSIACERPSSRKKSAGPPMPNDVRDASDSSSLTPGCSRSQASLVFVRQLIAQLVDVARAHEQDKVVAPDQVMEGLLRPDEVTDVGRARDLHREVARQHARLVL